MKLITYLVLFVFALTLTVTSCKKDDASKTQTKKEILTAKGWKMSSVKVNGVVVHSACDLDDIYTFASNGTYSCNVGTNKCDANDINYTGTWSLSSDEKSLIVDGDSMTIVELSGSQLVLTGTDGTDTTVVTLVPA